MSKLVLSLKLLPPHKFWLMALPSSNAYQMIQDLVIPQSSQIIKLDATNKVVLLPVGQAHQISFSQWLEFLNCLEKNCGDFR